jgi:hypothetical protein
VILGADGRPARHAFIPLPAGASWALVDGPTFAIEIDGLLRAAQVGPYCLTCNSPISTVTFPDRVDWRCAHRAGWISRSKPSEVEPLLQQLGWGLRCTVCAGPVAGDNSKAATTFAVTCGCTTREMRNPLAVGAAAMAGVGRG